MVSIPTNLSKPGNTILSLNIAIKAPKTISSQPISFQNFIGASELKPTIQLFQARKFRSRLVNLFSELLAVGSIARILKRHKKRGHLALAIGIQRGQLLFENFNAHAVTLP